MEKTNIYPIKNVKFLSFYLLLTLGTAIFNSYGQSSTSDPGVVINGIKWATRNVAALGTFADKPEDAGMFYQWNRKTAWAATSDATGWDSTIPDGDTWAKSNDPSPTGWRLPTYKELCKLIDTDKVTSEWVVSLNGVSGMKFTDAVTGNTLFLPVAGYRDGDDGALDYVGFIGFYWSCTQGGSGGAYGLQFGSGYVYCDGNFRYYGFCIRSVAE